MTWRRRGRAAAAAAAAAGALVILAACGQMGAALGRQWVTVDFSPGTTAATALHVRSACSHVPDTPPLPFPGSRLRINVLYGVRYNTTKSSPADMAELQVCLQKFKSVVGISQQDASQEGG